MAGTTLGRINRYIGVANDIFIDNKYEQTGHITEMQRLKRRTRMDIRTTKPHYPWGNKSESEINIIKGKDKRIIFQKIIPKRV